MAGVTRSLSNLRGALFYQRPNWFKVGLMQIITHGSYHGTRLAYWDKEVLEKGEFIVDERGLFVVPVWQSQAERVAAQWSKRASDSVVLQLVSTGTPEKSPSSGDSFKIAPGERVEILQIWKVSQSWIEKI